MLACWLALWGCAGEPRGPQILDGGPSPEPPARSAPVETPASVAIPYRPPPEGGTRYRVVLEYAGDQELRDEGGAAAQSDSRALELEYRELPVPEHPELLRLVLEGLHYRLEQLDPPAEREVEIGEDRLRTLADREVVLDLRGAQPAADLTPRKVLDRVFGTARLDELGSVVGVQSVGRPVARRFLSEFPLREAIAYARPALPPGPVAAGAEWGAIRYPPNPIGRLGLPLRVRYTLGGVQRLEGVPCAWVVFTAREEGEDLPSAAGFRFERVKADLHGEAWIELETSRIRRLRIEDDVRAAYQRRRPDQRLESHRLRYRGHLELELLDGPPAGEWADGSERFGKR